MGRHRLRTEFGMSAKEADEEPYEEAMIHFAIWRAQQDKEERDRRREEAKSRQPSANIR